MIAVGILWILAISYTTADDGQGVLPTFTWELESGTINLIIDFHDGGHSDVANLQRINSEFGDDEKDEHDNECILAGYLGDEPDVPITVDGCPGTDTFQVIFNSKRIHDSTFMVHKGQVKAFHQDEHQISGTDDEHVTILDVRDFPEKVRNIGDREISERSLPSSFKVTLSLSYDNLFLNTVCGGDHAVAKTRVEKIIKLAQTYFLDSATLGTKITLVVKEIKHTNHELKLRLSGVTCDVGCKIDMVANDIVAQNPLDVDNYHFISADNPGMSDVAGVAAQAGLPGWDVLGSVCLPKIHRVGITEFWGDPNDWEGRKLNAALTFAHELGHSLGMPHDFLGEDTNNPRLDSSYTSCLNVDGIMSYKDTKTTWSTCSNEAIATWFNQLATIGFNCKEGDDNTEAPTTTTTAAPSEGCVGDASTWNAGYGTCDTYVEHSANHGYCTSDCKGGQCAYQVCTECGECGAVVAVDCVWGEFGHWSTCSAECGGGTRTRSRPQATPASNGGAPCTGLAIETESCNPDACSEGCAGDASTWDAGWGKCNTYANNQPNHNWCKFDCSGGQCAYQVCTECGEC